MAAVKPEEERILTTGLQPGCDLPLRGRSCGPEKEAGDYTRSVFCDDQNLRLPSWAKTHKRGTRDCKHPGKNCPEGSKDDQVLGPQTLPSSGSHIQNGRVPPGEQI